MPELATLLTCTGCAACVDACPRAALAMVEDAEGFAQPRLDATRCIECGLCTRACPVVSPGDPAPAPGLPAAYAAWTTDEDVRARSSSGGVFAALAAHVLAEGGAVAGAAADGLAVRHELATTLDEARRLQGSKYLQSETTGIYRRVLERLKTGQRVLFSGTPCQVDGLLNLAAHARGREHLLTCDVACRGVPSRRFWQRYVAGQGAGYDQLVGFRDKRDGWRHSHAITLRASCDGRTARGTYLAGDLFLRAYSSAYLIMRNSCYACPFARLARRADLTLADFWGLRRFPEEHARGVSLVVAHTETGRTLLESCPSLVRHPASWAEALPANPRLYEGQSDLPLRAAFGRRHLAAALRHASLPVLNKLYTGRVPRWQVWWWPYKLELRRRDAAAARRRAELRQALVGDRLTEGSPS